MNRRRLADDSGFTLLELVMAIVIMGIITIPLANFMLAYLDNTTQTQQRMADSHDLQIAAAYLSQDVAGVGVRTSADPAAALGQSVWTAWGSGTTCGQGAVVGASLVLLLKSDDWTQVGATWTQSVDSVAYVATVSTPTAPGLLYRVSCPAAGSVSVATISHELSSATVNCYDSSSAAEACSGTGTAVPAKITLTLNLSSGSSDKSGESVALTGLRRQT